MTRPAVHRPAVHRHRSAVPPGVPGLTGAGPAPTGVATARRDRFEAEQQALQEAQAPAPRMNVQQVAKEVKP
jgi:hypothetical protein